MGDDFWMSTRRQHIVARHGFTSTSKPWCFTRWAVFMFLVCYLRLTDADGLPSFYFPTLEYHRNDLWLLFHSNFGFSLLCPGLVFLFKQYWSILYYLSYNERFQWYAIVYVFMVFLISDQLNTLFGIHLTCDLPAWCTVQNVGRVVPPHYVAQWLLCCFPYLWP